MKLLLVLKSNISVERKKCKTIAQADIKRWEEKKNKAPPQVCLRRVVEESERIV